MLEVFGKQLEDAKAPISVPEWEQVATAIKRRMQQAIYGDSTPEESISNLEEDIKGIL
jgi:multiple sugar transport system substrate-binding protein